MIHFTPKQTGAGKPLIRLIAAWLAENPRIRRVRLFTGGAIGLTVELQPAGAGEDTSAVCKAHCEQWREELEARLGQPVLIDWRDTDGTAIGFDQDQAPGRARWRNEAF